MRFYTRSSSEGVELLVYLRTVVGVVNLLFLASELHTCTGRPRTKLTLG